METEYKGFLKSAKSNIETAKVYAKRGDKESASEFLSLSQLYLGLAGLAKKETGVN